VAAEQLAAGQEEAPPGHLVADGSPSAEDGGPGGPSDAEEASFLAGQASAAPDFDARPASPKPQSEAPETGELPPLDDLVQRIPAPTRALIDELFRAKFVTVKRLPKTAFKT
jgi:hypothetical protein